MAISKTAFFRNHKGLSKEDKSYVEKVIKYLNHTDLWLEYAQHSGNRVIDLWNVVIEKMHEHNQKGLYSAPSIYYNSRILTDVFCAYFDLPPRHFAFILT